MARKRVPLAIETRVLLDCRRRCCVCFGLERDAAIKRGQIAHLDHDPDNNELENLAFLCFEHHDEFDSSTSQSKGLTSREIRAFRTELLSAITTLWNQPVKFGELEARPVNNIAGHYVRQSDWDPAELDVTLLPNGRVNVSGLALWGAGREYGANIGELDFTTALIEGRHLVYTDAEPQELANYRLEIEFKEGWLTAHEHLGRPRFGMNVTFAGDYRRV